jgi:sporulation protein YlmC with PRC-barrel domain
MRNGRKSSTHISQAAYLCAVATRSLFKPVPRCWRPKDTRRTMLADSSYRIPTQWRAPCHALRAYALRMNVCTITQGGHHGHTASGTSGADIVGSGTGEGPGPEVMAAATLDDTQVISSDGEDVGKISDIMLDVRSGRIAYAVLSEGGFLGMGTNLHAIPWNALTLDTDAKCFRVSIEAQRIKDDPGFDKDHWPSMADTAWGTTVHQYYNREPYWSSTRSVEDLPPSDI